MFCVAWFCELSSLVLWCGFVRTVVWFGVLCNRVVSGFFASCGLILCVVWRDFLRYVVWFGVLYIVVWCAI